MKKNNLPSKGFTLIEVLISLVILSIITVITSSFLQSSIQSKEIVFSKSAHTLKINLLADALREDVTNAVNIPLLDSRGEPQTRTFYSGQNSDSFTFITKIRSGKSFSSSMVQVQYLVEDDKLLRRQFFAPAPSNLSRFSETVLLQNIKNINFEFSDNNTWFYFWPTDQLTSLKFPRLIKIDLENQDEQIFSWIVHSNHKNIYE